MMTKELAEQILGKVSLSPEQIQAILAMVHEGIDVAVATTPSKADDLAWKMARGVLEKLEQKLIMFLSSKFAGGVKAATAQTA